MKAKGFTLIELLIVVAIIGIIAAIAIPNLLVALQKGRQKATMADMTSIGTAVESYIVDWGIAPGRGGVIITEINQSWFIPFYIKVIPTSDSWGTIFEYAAGEGGVPDSYSVTSLGRNKFNDSMALGDYTVTSLTDFNKDITYSDGRFTVFPQVRN